MTDFAIREVSPTKRCRWVLDEEYETRGSYGLDTEEETKEAEDTEIAALERGEYVALGCIVENKVDCPCPRCNGWHETDSIWGVVIEPDAEKLDEFANYNFAL